MNRMTKKSLHIAAGVLSVASVAVLTASAEGSLGVVVTPSAGYIDPSATSAIVAAVSAGAVAIGAVVGVVWRNVKRRAAKVLHVNENAHKEVEEEFEITADGQPDTVAGGVWDIDVPDKQEGSSQQNEAKTETPKEAFSATAAEKSATPAVSAAGDAVVIRDPALPYEIHIHIHNECCANCRFRIGGEGEKTSGRCEDLCQEQENTDEKTAVVEAEKKVFDAEAGASRLEADRKAELRTVARRVRRV